MWAPAHHFSTGLVVNGPVITAVSTAWMRTGAWLVMTKALCVVPGTQRLRPTLSHTVSPVVSILPGEQEESDLILEEVDPHWEEDEHQVGSTSISPRISEAAPADEEKDEVVEQTPRWEPEKALKKRLSGKITGLWYRIPKVQKGRELGPSLPSPPSPSYQIHIFLPMGTTVAKVLL